MLQTSGEVFVPLFLGVGTLMVIKIYSGTIGYVFNEWITIVLWNELLHLEKKNAGLS